MPDTAAASRTSGAIASKARCMGCTAKGRFTMTDASSKPWNENTRLWPNRSAYALPKGVAPPKVDEHVIADDGGRQHERKRQRGLGKALSREVAEGQDAREDDANGEQHEDAERTQPQRQAEGGPIHLARISPVRRAATNP